MSARTRSALALLSLTAWASASAQPQPQASASAPPGARGAARRTTARVVPRAPRAPAPIAPPAPPPVQAPRPVPDLAAAPPAVAAPPPQPGDAEVLPPAAPPPPPEPEVPGDGWLEGLRVRAGGLYIKPTGRGQEVELSHVSGYARLAGVRDGPIAGSSTSLGGSGMFAAIVGYAPPFLDRQLSIETILALPFEQKMYAGGTLASTSLAPKAIGTLPTGVPALGKELGTVTVLPPVVTAVYRFFPRSWVRPYLGAGGCALLVLDARITNPVLASVRPPKVEIPPAFGWVAQVGTELRFGLGVLPGRSFFLTADVKYIGGLEVTAHVKDIWVSLPGLPVYGAAQVGDNTVHMKIDPLVTFLGVGMDL